MKITNEIARGERMRRQYKCKQCDFVASGEREGMDHERENLFTHSLEYIVQKPFDESTKNKEIVSNE